MNLSFEAYEKAIRALQTVEEHDYKRFVYEFAALCPNEFLSVINQKPTVDRKIIDVYKDTNSIISAIKECRALTNWGLKEAKDYVEALLDAKGIRQEYQHLYPLVPQNPTFQ